MNIFYPEAEKSAADVARQLVEMAEARVEIAERVYKNSQGAAAGVAGVQLKQAQKSLRERKSQLRRIVEGEA